MSCFNNGMKALKKIWDQVSKELGVIIEDINKVTGVIKDLELNPTIDAIIKAIPVGSKVETYINAGLIEVSAIEGTVEDLAQRLTDWLNKAVTQPDLESKLIKISALAAKAADADLGNPIKADHVYDSAVELRVIADKNVA